MAVPTISGIVASNDANGSLQAVVTFSVAVTAADLSGVTISEGTINSVSVNGLTLVFLMIGQGIGSILTMDFASTNTITADDGGESLAEDLDVAVTNNIVGAISSYQPDLGPQITSAAIHTAVKVTADAAETACKAAC